MKICITTKTLGVGGAEVLLKMVVPHLISRGYDITILYFMENKDTLVKDFLALGCHVSYVGELTSSGLFRTTLKFNKTLELGKFDVVFDHSPLTSVLSRLFKNKYNYRLVYLEHNIWNAYNVVTRCMNKLTYKLTDEVICCSEEVYQSNGKQGIVLDNALDIDKFRMNQNLIDVRQHLSIDSETKIILNIANMSNRKNQLMLIRAFELIEVPSKLLIIGQKKEAYQSIKEHVESSCRKDDIILYGPTKYVSSFVKASDIFSLTSFEEGLPISLLESMSMGLVPVCTPVGGIPSVIDETTGYLVAIGDINDMAKKLSKLISDDDERLIFSQNCVRLIKEKYNILNYVEKLVTALENNNEDCRI